MGHSKASMLSDMASIGQEIIDLLTKEDVTIKPDHLSIPEDAEIIYRADFIRPAWLWLREIHSCEFALILKIKKQQPEEMWHRYKTWGGFEEHQEVVKLRSALSDLRAKLVSRGRPDFFKKSKRNAKEHKTKVGIEATEPSS